MSCLTYAERHEHSFGHVPATGGDSAGLTGQSSSTLCPPPELPSLSLPLLSLPLLSLSLPRFLLALAPSLLEGVRLGWPGA